MSMTARLLNAAWGVLLLAMALSAAQADEPRFPGKDWESGPPAALGMSAEKLDQLAEYLGGRGCVVKDGFVVKTWGDQAQRSDWLSSVKPVLSTLLFFAVEEGLVRSVDQPIADLGWDLKPKDRTMTFRHLGAMTSGYARPEAPGAAWAYNDFAIQLYQKTLFDKVFKADARAVAEDSGRLGALGPQDGLEFGSRRRLSASVRDFARIAWFWLNRGRWGERQVLPRRYFDEYMRPQTPKNLPATQKAATDDYLGIGSYGGGSDHFTQFGAGIYGFNWWFNDTGRLHPDARTWPDAPPDTFMSIGAGGNNSVIIPSLGLVLASARGNWGDLDAGNPDSRFNRCIRLLVEAASAPEVHAATPSGTPSKWDAVTLDFHGPQADAMDNDPNPFLDYRLRVRFTGPNGKAYDVPGFFGGDGRGGRSGNVWRVRFSPDEAGEWRFRASFRKGPGVAVSLEADEGEPAAFDGSSGTFTVAPQDPQAPGFYKWGPLEYAGTHYLKFRDGPYWIKGGTDSPEDFLAYAGFANTPRATHRYESHIADWRDGDPDWDDGQGKGIIGALNYLASQHVNSIYLLPMNIGGDGRNVWPYMGPIDGKGSPANDNLHFDLARLRQWGIVFDHAQRRGLCLHFVLNEAEEPNKRELDDGALGVERKLYYRELAARFGHLPALQWNLCEEYNLGFRLPPERIKQYARYLHEVDPYDHPITVHHAGKVEQAWAPFLGDRLFPVTSFQTTDTDIVETWRERSAAAGFPQVIGMDEFYPDKANAANADRHRREYTWPIYLSGGQLEYILDTLLKTEDFRTCEPHWRYMWFARSFVEDNLPFWEMQPMDGLLAGESHYAGRNNDVAGQVLGKEGEVYAVYLPRAEKTGALDLSKAPGRFVQRWYNPRTGEFDPSSRRKIEGGRPVALGPPPRETAEDWVVLITQAE